MTDESLLEDLAAAGKKFDGHVTHGSISEQMKVLALAFKKVLPEDILQQIREHADPLTPFVEYLRKE